MNAQELLEEADRLLTTVMPGTRGRWPRACATLLRLALEKALDDFWTARLPEAKNCSMRAQLLLLPRYAGTEVSGDARDAWFGLARATHHHAYELAPTAAELRSWHDLVSKIIATISSNQTHRDDDQRQSTGRSMRIEHDLRRMKTGLTGSGQAGGHED